MTAVLPPRTPTGQMRLACHDLRVLRAGSVVLDGVSIQLHAGSWVSVMGPNGAGKTTLLQVVAGNVEPARGQVLLDGDPVGSLPPRERARRLALVPQVPAVPPGMALADYVLLGRTPYMGRFATERDSDLRAVAEALERLELTAFADRPLATLSGGERQRAFLARAIAQAAPTLLLDEPTTALDIGRQQQVLELVDQLRRDRELTVLSSMHDLTLAAQYADELVLIDDGRVVAGGPPDAVLTEANIARHYHGRVRVLGKGRTRTVVPVRGERDEEDQRDGA